MAAMQSRVALQTEHADLASTVWRRRTCAVREKRRPNSTDLCLVSAWISIFRNCWWKGRECERAWKFEGGINVSLSLLRNFWVTPQRDLEFMEVTVKEMKDDDVLLWMCYVCTITFSCSSGDGPSDRIALHVGWWVRRSCWRLVAVPCGRLSVLAYRLHSRHCMREEETFE